MFKNKVWFYKAGTSTLRFWHSGSSKVKIYKEEKVKYVDHPLVTTNNEGENLRTKMVSVPCSVMVPHTKNRNLSPGCDDQDPNISCLVRHSFFKTICISDFKKREKKSL